MIKLAKNAWFRDGSIDRSIQKFPQNQAFLISLIKMVRKCKVKWGKWSKCLISTWIDRLCRFSLSLSLSLSLSTFPVLRSPFKDHSCTQDLFSLRTTSARCARSGGIIFTIRNITLTPIQFYNVKWNAFSKLFFGIFVVP